MYSTFHATTFSVRGKLVGRVAGANEPASATGISTGAMRVSPGTGTSMPEVGSRRGALGTVGHPCVSASTSGQMPVVQSSGTASVGSGVLVGATSPVQAQSYSKTSSGKMRPGPRRGRPPSIPPSLIPASKPASVGVIGASSAPQPTRAANTASADHDVRRRERWGA